MNLDPSSNLPILLAVQISVGYGHLDGLPPHFSPTFQSPNFIIQTSGSLKNS